MTTNITSKNVELLKSKLEQLLPENYNIYDYPLVFQNNVHKHGLVLKDGQLNFGHPVCIEDIVQGDFIDQKATEYAVTIMKIMFSSPDILNRFDFESLSWENIKDKLTLLILPMNLNKEFIKDYIYEEYLDFYVVPAIQFDNKYMLYISKEYIDYFQLDSKLVMQVAHKNLMEEKYTIQNITTILKAFKDFDTLDDEWIPLYVLKLERTSYGSSVLLNKGILDKILDIFHVDSIIIIPSSLDEVMFTLNLNNNIENINSLIQYVNTTIATEQILSDHSYIYMKDYGFVSNIAS